MRLASAGGSGCTSYIRFADSLSAWVAKAFAWCIMVMTLGVCYEVFVRYVVNAPDACGPSTSPTSCTARCS